MGPMTDKRSRGSEGSNW